MPSFSTINVLASEANHQNVKNLQINSKGRTWYGQGKFYSRSKVSRTHLEHSIFQCSAIKKWFQGNFALAT
jgi:hypothetical protein